MNIGGKSRISTPTLKKETVSGSSGRNDVILSFYGEPPSYELSLDEFEEYALARLKVCFVSLHLALPHSQDISIYFIDTCFKITCFVDTSHLTITSLQLKRYFAKLKN